jgi:hypothetical protein
MKSTIGLIFILGLTLTACKAASTSATTSPLSLPKPVEVTEQPLPTHQTNPSAPLMEEDLVQISIRNLSLRLNIPSEQIKVISVEQVTWPDASLGCSQSGVAYIQVLTPGYLIQLDANGKIYVYHTDTSDRVVQCKNELGVPGLPIIPSNTVDH